MFLFRPTEAKIAPLGSRDVFQESRQIYQLLLTYTFSVQLKSSEITVDLPGLQDHLYSSELDWKFWMLFSQNKKYLAAGEAYPSRVRPFVLCLVQPRLLIGRRMCNSARCDVEGYC